MKEIWRAIEGYDGRYAISSWGRIKNAKGLLTPFKNHKGYLRITLYKDGKPSNHRVNRLVAKAFISNPYNLPEVNHIDGNKQNNSFSNLEWVTGEQNRAHERLMKKLLEEAENP